MVQFGIFGVATSLRPPSSKGNQILEMSPCIWHHQETRSAFLRRFSLHPWYLVKGNIYGLASAPRTWTMHVCKCLKASGWIQHSLDKMLFFLYKKVKGFAGEILVAVAVVYVDDFLVTFSDHFNKGELLSLFS